METKPDYFSRYQVDRRRAWPAIEQFFGDLPQALFRQGVILKNDMAIAYSNYGQFEDILAAPHHHPLLYLPYWLINDWDLADNAPHPAAGDTLLAATTFSFAAAHLQQSILDDGTNFDKSFLFLAQALVQQADFFLGQVQPAASPFWPHYHRYWREYRAAMTVDHSARRKLPANPLRAVGGRWAFAKLSAAALALPGERAATLPHLDELIDRLNFVLQIRYDIAGLQADLGQGRYSYPLLQAMHAAGIDPDQPVEPDQLLGALVLTGAVAQVGQECLLHLERCRTIAGQLGLTTLGHYLVDVEALLVGLVDLFSLQPSKKTAETSPRRPPIHFAPRINHLAVALETAEAYLRADLTFRQSWEIQRGLSPGLPELTATAFPSGLIVETLAAHGHQMQAQVEQIFDTLYANQFRYYHNYLSLPPDADDLGLMLRLFRYAAPDRQPAYRQLLERPLGWMANSVLPSGEIPVWFEADDGPDEPAQILVWGRHCAATEINLLLGLMDYNWARFQPIIESSVLSILARFEADGLGAALYYLPPYVVQAGLRLTARLAEHALAETMQVKVDRMQFLFVDWFGRETERVWLSAQDAALLLLAERHHPDRAETSSRVAWLERLLKTQQHDGGWPAEPLFLVPHRRGVSWYASRLVTTAFCYHALKLYAGEQ